ncbi:MAG: 30S ribosomal protein S3 [Erysipelotrichaceae bacterium]|nr:30S ribosomal protein S3 [Erysipelotrichaceae bacterium]
MGHKVNPVGMRIGVIRDWESRWYAENDYGTLVNEDDKIRKFLFKELKAAYVSRIEIERSKNRLDIILRTARPGVIIGTNGEAVELLKKKLEAMVPGKNVYIKVVEIANPDLDANLVARSIAEQLEARASFRTAQKKAIQKTMRSGAKGIKTKVSGRLGGADIARSEGYSEGTTPLHTLRSDIDFAICEAMTQYGKLGIKVWVCRGEVLPGKMVTEPEAPKFNRRDDRRRPRRDNRRQNNNNNAEQAAAKATAEEGGN